MFTGLVESMGTLVRRTDQGGGARLVLSGTLVAGPHAAPENAHLGRDPVVLGESIAVDGVCLTVDRLLEAGGPGPTSFEADASSETLAKTTLGTLAVGAKVNLERARPVGGRLGGHIVSGHVDGRGRVVDTRAEEAFLRVTFEAPSELMRFIAPKGSITVSGVSLTVNDVSGSTFDVMLVPHTRDKTSLGHPRVGTIVNLEVDVLARYVARLFETARSVPNPSPDTDHALLERLRASGYV